METASHDRCRVKSIRKCRLRTLTGEPRGPSVLVRSLSASKLVWMDGSIIIRRNQRTVKYFVLHKHIYDTYSTATLRDRLWSGSDSLDIVVSRQVRLNLVHIVETSKAYEIFFVQFVPSHLSNHLPTILCITL